MANLTDCDFSLSKTWKKTMVNMLCYKYGECRTWEEQFVWRSLRKNPLASCLDYGNRSHSTCWTWMRFI